MLRLPWRKTLTREFHASEFRIETIPPLTEGEYYHTDIIGLACVSTSGDDLGRCVAIENFGAGDVIEIERPSAKKFMIPVSAVTFEGGLIRVEDIFAGE